MGKDREPVELAYLAKGRFSLTGDARYCVFLVFLNDNEKVLKSIALTCIATKC
jgi:hypothetical protein